MPLQLPSSLRKHLPRDLQQNAGTWLRQAWLALAQLPGGRQLYSRLLGLAIPYTGSISAEVLELKTGYAQVQMADRRGLRNHLNSLHAVALCNLAELTGNLALSFSMPSDARFIVRALSIEYLKKARGTITASCDCPVPTSNEPRDYEVTVTLRNEKAEEVCRAKLITLIGPIKVSSHSA